MEKELEENKKVILQFQFEARQRENSVILRREYEKQEEVESSQIIIPNNNETIRLLQEELESKKNQLVDIHVQLTLQEETYNNSKIKKLI